MHINQDKIQGRIIVVLGEEIVGDAFLLHTFHTTVTKVAGGV